ncbi:MAG: ATP-binding protein [Terricaulis silvestris]
MMRERAGLPIAAHLALLVALALAAAFAVTMAVVIWLPPRPPDAMRGDMLLDAFARGYAQASSTHAAPVSTGALVWSFQSKPLDADDTHVGMMLRGQLASRLNVDFGEVRVRAKAAGAEMLVYRVRTVEHDMMITHEGPIPGAPQPPFASGHPPPRPAEPPIPPEPPLFAPPPPGVMLLSGFEFAAALPDGQWLVMSQGRNWELLGWFGRAALVMGGTLALLSLLALAFARRLAAPIQSFAHAVEAVGVDPQSAPAPESGPRELRSAARAVNAMQARLRALIADRTQTLATVAHDMRTPLMRLRLAAENVEPQQRERIAKEIGEVEALIASFISFARDDPAEEPRVRLDLGALLQSLVDDQIAAGRQGVSFEGEERLVMTGQSLGLKRLFSNLIDNALKYGQAARVSLRRDGDRAIVEIADDGPGVPEDQREAVFRPFVRLRAGAGGAGLGLPAARSIARAHGGDVVFQPADHGALVGVNLPL